jgi:hypothetical protein
MKPCFIIILVIFVYSSCQKEPTPTLGPSKIHSSTFTVNGANYKWGESSTIGFLWADFSTPGYYFDIHEASDSVFTNATFYKFLFIDIGGKQLTNYTNSDTVTGVSYYDNNGYGYYDFYSSCYSSITITKWSMNEITGYFSAKLYNSSGGYKTLFGNFISFYSDDVMFSVSSFKSNNNLIKLHRSIYENEKLKLLCSNI